MHIINPLFVLLQSYALGQPCLLVSLLYIPSLNETNFERACTIGDKQRGYMREVTRALGPA
jgi:hypothetical protein